MKSPAGKTLKVRAFWDGGNTWKLRFMPDEVGTWIYAGDPASGNPLRLAKGSFTCGKQNRDGRFNRHGALRVNKGGRFLEHADGTPFFWLADTAWSGAIKSSAEGWQKYLDNRVTNGFTGIQLVATHWMTGLKTPESHKSFTLDKNGNVQVQPEFFRRIDSRMDAINEMGLLAVPVMLWARQQSEENAGFLPEPQAIRLAEYVEARYHAHHVAWIPCGDGDFFGDNASRWQRIGRALFGNIEHAPVFMHPGGKEWPYAELYNETWLDVVGYQSGHSSKANHIAWLISGPPALEWKLKPTRPFINLEPLYEDIRGAKVYDVRKALYRSCLVHPTAGTSYGAHGVWSWEETLAEPLAHKGVGKAKPWSQAMEMPGSQAVKHLAAFFQDLPWWDLIPAPDLQSAFAPGQTQTNSEAKSVKYDANKHHVSISSTAKGNVVVAYMPVGGRLELKGGALKKSMKAQWFNPREGSYQTAALDQGRFALAPDASDWVLLLR